MSATISKHWVEQVRELEWGTFEIGEPASVSQIAKLNQFLGFQIPDDLEQFYLLANGITGDNNGWEYQVIGSVEQVKENLRAIQNGRQSFDNTEVIYPTLLKQAKIVPLDGGLNVVGMGVFYAIDVQTIDNEFSIRNGIYRYFVSQPTQMRDAQITLEAQNLAEYAAIHFGFSQAD